MAFMIMTGCNMTKPNLKDDYIGMDILEKKLAYKVDRCRYAQQYTKIDLKCDEIEQRNRKIENITIYNILKEKKQLPLIYRQAGSEPMTFDDLFKYIK